MIPMFIIYLVRKYRFFGNRKKFFRWAITRIRIILFQTIIVGSILLLVSVTLKAQNRQVTYNVIRNGSIAGKLKFQQVCKGDSTWLKTESEVKASFLFTIIAFAKEEAVYKNGILLYSSVYRKRNGVERTNKQTRLWGYEYLITNGNKTEVTKNYPIRFSLLSMYSYEPKQINRVYSDFFQTYVPVEKISESRYKVSLPDGSYNYYNYKDGVCSVVEVHASLYSALLVINK